MLRQRSRALRVFCDFRRAFLPERDFVLERVREMHTPEKENPRTETRSGSQPETVLLAEIELLEETFITVAGGALEVIQQAAAFGHHHEETAARCVVLRVALEMFGELLNPRGKEGDLHVCAASVFVVHFDALKFVRHCHISYF